MTSAVTRPSSIPERIEITGITFDLDKPLEHSLLIDLTVVGAETTSVLLKKRGVPGGICSLRTPLSLHENSTLTIQLQEQCEDKVKTLPSFTSSLEDIWRKQDQGRSKVHAKKYEIPLEDSKKKIWLNFVQAPSAPPSGMKYVGQDVHRPATALHASELASAPGKLASSASRPGSKRRHTDHLARAKRSSEALDTLFSLPTPQGSSPVNDLACSADPRLIELRDLKDQLLEGIKVVHPRATECIPGTRKTILDEIDNMTDSYDNPNMLWIRGAPGSGKSSLSLSAKARLLAQGRLVTYFRFDRNDAATTTSLALWRQVAYELARRFTSVSTHILQELKDGRVDLNSPTSVYMSLIENPLSKITTPPMDRPFVIIIDALDECGGTIGRSSPDRQELLRTIGLWHKLPNHFKLLLTSREEGDIIRILSSITSPINIPSGNSLIDNPHARPSIEANEDIRTFLKFCFSQITTRIPGLGRHWPGSNVIEDMIHRAAGNFMWVATATKFADSGISHESRLNEIMGDEHSNGMKPLYSLYSTILTTAFRDVADNGLEVVALRAVLGTMVCARRPLSDDEYMKLPIPVRINLPILQSIRDGLSSVIDMDRNLRFAHKSFDDFLLSESCPRRYAVNVNESQHLLTQLCLETMMAGLCFNICHLETSCLRNEEVPDIAHKVTTSIPSLLSYSCCFWADHLFRTPYDQWLMDIVKEMILDKLLYWFEVMSLLKEMNRVSLSLFLVLQWFHHTLDEGFSEFIRDARQFVRAFIRPIAQSAPHIYISALPFAPKYSVIARHFLYKFPQVLELSMGKPNSWPACNFTSEHHTLSVNSVAFSPDEKYFSSGSGDSTICICDSDTGNLVFGPLNAPSPIQQVFFGSGGKCVWATCSDGQVIGWNIKTGDEHACFQAGERRDIVYCSSLNDGHTITSISFQLGSVMFWDANTGEQLLDVLPISGGQPLRNVAFSFDGCYVAIAKYTDNTIGIWKLDDEREIRGPSHTQPESIHPDFITALAFSVDSYFAVSGSYDGNVLIWNGETGNVVGNPLDTQKGMVQAVAYYHENRLLVSTSALNYANNSAVIMVWNASTHEVILGPLENYTSSIVTIALSHDGRRALSGSGDGTTRMWDLSKKGECHTAQATDSDIKFLQDVTFSPCGKMLATLGHNRTIRFWDASTGMPLLEPINCYSPYSKIIFSPSGRHIATCGAEDGSLRVWSVDTGECSLRLYFMNDMDDHQRHNLIRHAAFRLVDQAQALVMCCDKGTVRIQRFEDGSVGEGIPCSCPQPENPSRPSKIIALSPNGLAAIVRDDSRKRAKRHYIWTTTASDPLPINIAKNSFISRNRIEFSPSGQFFATPYRRRDPAKMTLRSMLPVWHTQTGELIVKPFKFDGEISCLAFSPNDRYIVFSSSAISGTFPIWIWNFHDDTHIPEFYVGHTKPFYSLSFSPDGERLMSYSVTLGQIRVWDTANLLSQTPDTNGFAGIGTHIQDGWVVDTKGRLLFWVPKDHRSRLVWPQNVAVIESEGTRTELDLTRFTYGENWIECFKGGK